VKACQFGHGTFGASNLTTFGSADKTIPLFAFDYLCFTFPLLESENSVIKIVQIRAAFFRLHHPRKKCDSLFSVEQKMFTVPFTLFNCTLLYGEMAE
jgi:hypothetical protein